MYALVFNQLMTMFIIGIGGFVFAKIFKVDNEQQKFLSKFLLYFINPSIILNSFNLEFDAAMLKQLIFVAFISLIIHVVMIFTGLLSSKNHIDRLGIVFTNCGFIGIPLIRGVFGNIGVFYLMGYLVVFNILLWTYGYYQMSGSVNLKKIITNPNIICIILGMIIFCMPFTLPKTIERPLSMIADLNTATSMVLIGILLAGFKPKESKRYIPQLARFTICRLAVTAIINIAVLFCIYKIFYNFENIGNLQLMLFVILICSICPAGTSISSMSVVFNKDATYASLAVSFTSLFCIFSIPAFVALAEKIIK